MIGRERRARHHEEELRRVERDEEEMTPGARRRIRVLEEKWRRLVRTLMVVGAILVITFALTGWQIGKAFHQQDSERTARISASASISAFLCQRIDSVGNGVASLVRVSLSGVEDPKTLRGQARESYNRFLRYAEAQERPPRCRELALKIATLTGADPEDVKITPIRLHRVHSGDRSSEP